WRGFIGRLQAMEKRLDSLPLASCGCSAGSDATPVTDRHIVIETPTLFAKLDRRRGLAISEMRFAGQARPVIGGLPHGTFDDIGLQADWYTGDCVFEAPGEHKITDLEWAATRIAHGD